MGYLFIAITLVASFGFCDDLEMIEKKNQKIFKIYEQNKENFKIEKTLRRLKKIKPHAKIPDVLDRELELQARKIHQGLDQMNLILESK